MEEKKYADSDDKLKERRNHVPNLSLFQNVKRQEDVDGGDIGNARTIREFSLGLKAVSAE